MLEKGGVVEFTYLNPESFSNPLGSFGCMGLLEQYNLSSGKMQYFDQ